MAKFSQKLMGKEVGSASVYAEPHTMEGTPTNVNTYQKTITGAKGINEMNISVGGLSKGNTKPTKTDGIKIRGTGAATKGTMARGPMG